MLRSDQGWPGGPRSSIVEDPNVDSSYQKIKFDVVDGVGKITFNLPQFGNALDLEGVKETHDALFRAEARDDVVR